MLNTYLLTEQCHTSPGRASLFVAWCGNERSRFSETAAKRGKDAHGRSCQGIDHENHHSTYGERDGCLPVWAGCDAPLFHVNWDRQSTEPVSAVVANESEPQAEQGQELVARFPGDPASIGPEPSDPELASLDDRIQSSSSNRAGRQGP
jgi:hypothetical protein